MNRTMSLPAAGAALIGLALASCGPSVSSHAPGNLVPGSGTYAWGGTLVVPNEGQGYVLVNQNLRKRIQAAMDTALAVKGYRKVDTTDAQFIARYAVGVKTESSSAPVTDAGPDAPVPLTSCTSSGCWNGWEMGPNTMSTAGSQSFAPMMKREAGVVVEFLDRKTGQVAWRGVYKDEATGKAPTPERIDKAMQQLFKSLPPATGSR